MSVSRIFIISIVVLFLGIGAAALFKSRTSSSQEEFETVSLEEIALTPILDTPKEAVKITSPPVSPKAPKVEENLPQVDRIAQLFSTGPDKLPIVETISYKSRVEWIQGRPAWIADYASYYGTSRHFIARSLNGKSDYFTQKVSPGDRFNVFRKDVDVRFHLLADLSRCKMWFYYIDDKSGECELIKTYQIGVGRVDEKTASGSLTPIGKYSLGSKVAIYKPGVEGYFQDQKIDMIRVFGTRWIPFDKEVEGCTGAAKGLGIHGAPWIVDPVSGELIEDRLGVGGYSSDGCLHMLKEDMEELFAIIISKPTTVEIVKEYRFEAQEN